METIRFWQGRKYWYVAAADFTNRKRVSEIHITNGNVSTINSEGHVACAFECFGRLRIEQDVAYIEGY